jgi:hypothetical protein
MHRLHSSLDPCHPYRRKLRFGIVRNQGRVWTASIGTNGRSWEARKTDTDEAAFARLESHRSVPGRSEGLERNTDRWERGTTYVRCRSDSSRPLVARSFADDRRSYSPNLRTSIYLCTFIPFRSRYACAISHLSRNGLVQIANRVQATPSPSSHSPYFLPRRPSGPPALAFQFSASRVRRAPLPRDRRRRRWSTRTTPTASDR